MKGKPAILLVGFPVFSAPAVFVFFDNYFGQE
jgi:hypothetical protein